MNIQVLSILFTVVLFFNQSNTVTLSGGLSAYDREPSEATLEYRCETGDLQCDHSKGWPDILVAVADCSLIGKEGTLTYEDGRSFSVAVFDCAGVDGVDENGEALITGAGIVAELDYASWVHYGLGKATLTIYR